MSPIGNLKSVSALASASNSPEPGGGQGAHVNKVDNSDPTIHFKIV